MRYNKPHKQTGAALFVALIVLVIIAFLGINALKSSSSDARVVTSVQAANISFNAAESAINKVIHTMEQKEEDSDEYGYIIKDIMLAPEQVLTYCIKNKGNLLESTGACGQTDWFDERKVVKAESKIKMSDSFSPPPGWSLNGDVLFGMRNTIVVGYGEVPAVNVKKVNVQNLGVFGPMPAGDLKLNN